LDIIGWIIQKNVPLKTKVQSELEDRRATIADTGAGRVVMEKAQISMGRLEEQLSVLRETINDNVPKFQMEHVTKQRQQDLKNLQSVYEVEKRNLENYSENHTKVLRNKVYQLENRLARSERNCVVM